MQKREAKQDLICGKGLHVKQKGKKGKKGKRRRDFPKYLFTLSLFWEELMGRIKINKYVNNKVLDISNRQIDIPTIPNLEDIGRITTDKDKLNVFPKQ